MLEQRRAVLGERLAQVAARARARRDDRYMRILCERQQDSLSRDVSWLDHLIQEERAGSPAGTPPSRAAATCQGRGVTASARCAGAGSSRSPVPLSCAPPPATGAAASSQIDNSSSVKDGI